jgi:preprotein translocase subunit SecA
VFLDRNTGRAIFGINLCDPWKYDSRLEKLTEKMVQPSPVRGVEKGTILKRKVGRNQPCPCGSGMKYKKCHGH